MTDPTPTQTTSAMDASDAALDVWCAFCGIVEDHSSPRLALAAALCAAADQAVPEEKACDVVPGAPHFYALQRRATRRQLLAIAAELKGNHTSEND